MEWKIVVYMQPSYYTTASCQKGTPFKHFFTIWLIYAYIFALIGRFLTIEKAAASNSRHQARLTLLFHIHPPIAAKTDEKQHTAHDDIRCHTDPNAMQADMRCKQRSKRQAM